MLSQGKATLSKTDMSSKSAAFWKKHPEIEPGAASLARHLRDFLPAHPNFSRVGLQKTRMCLSSTDFQPPGAQDVSEQARLELDRDALRTGQSLESLVDGTVSWR